MIPSLVAEELQRAIVEYLSTTFALSDDETRDALARFLAHPTDGIFRGPYLRVRTPFRTVDDDWKSPLDWLPEGFVPYRHQAAAFARLSSAGRTPVPTVVTTGTGSGKTECFLYPALDHCVRQRAAGRRGIKAVLLYPMNALASDQARRLANLLDKDPRLQGVTAGLYIGGEGSHTSPGPNHLVDSRSALRASPPDILLTNYKMLDFLLLRREDHDLWADNQPDTLQYIVLDEFHTYDGAQGTDVAMLLRRLGATLKMATDASPLGSATPVATSATLGAATAGDAMRDFAERVFGTAFSPESVITEDRQTADEACGHVDYTLPIPDVDDVLALDEEDFDGTAAAFTGQAEPFNLVDLGNALLAHPLTRAVLTAVGERSREWGQAVDTVITRAPTWGAVAQHSPLRVRQALARYLGLLSLARRAGPNGQDAPLFAVEVQVWVREVSRLLRSLSAEPSFRWLDSAVSEADEEKFEPSLPELPAIYCRHCGRAGWMALVSELDGALQCRPTAIYREAVQRSAQVRALIRASAEEADIWHLDPVDRALRPEPNERTIPVLASPGEAEARRSECPSCRASDAIRFLGAQVASLASVTIGQLFGSNLVHAEERKLLAFTDSVQDASHRAAFFAGRTYRFNLRTVIARVVQREDRVSLADLGTHLLLDADGPADLHALTPPDLLRHSQIRTLWGRRPSEPGRQLLERRLALEATLELGLRSRVGRTLELTGAVAASVAVDDLPWLVGLVREAHMHVAGQEVLEGTRAGYSVYLMGLLERLRLQGGVFHPWLDQYVSDGGRLWHIWGGRADGMPPFTEGQSRPTFLTTGPSRNFDSLTALAATPTWVVDWAMRTLGVVPDEARQVNRRVFEILAGEEVVSIRTSQQGATVYGLDPARIVVVDAGDDEEPEPTIVRCRLCAHRHVAPPDRLSAWIGQPCLRYRCRGTFEPAPPDSTNFYRRLYRSGAMRRVVTAEHTGLLHREEREELEEQFKRGVRPDAPNVIACTPTLELGIDIGDLSAVMLTSVPRRPASYVQRVGRAGRLSGNALVAAFIPTDPRALYYLAQPEHMIAGEIRPPNCYLDAIEILRRQYLAYLVDRVADSSITAPPMPAQVGALMARGLEPDGWMRTILDVSMLEARHVDTFVTLFGAHLAPETVEQLREFASGGIESAVKAAFSDWQERMAELSRRRDRLKAHIDKLEQQPHLEEEQQRDLRRFKGERHAVVAMMQRARNEYTPSALEGLGLLPNYTLIDDAATLESTLWWRDDNDEYQSEQREYVRPASLALTEFAPGNTFYAGGHRMIVDALEIGTPTEPLYQSWRLCPECGYGGVDDGTVAIPSCPRCGLVAIADTGARHTLLHLRHVYCSDSEERARVFDEADEREQQHYATVTTVDVDPSDIAAAWRHREITFGMELARVAVVRSVNFGPGDRPGERVQVAGRELRAHRFRTCRYCGAVFGTRERNEAHHHGWCLVRSGARTEAWDEPILVHEVRTEAVRLLLPVATFEVDERLASFKAALLLGLRLHFGGEPEHLRVITSDFPGSGGPGRRRFLVIHDTVPGGTGYLGRIADPERLQSILVKARDAISRCPCRDEGRIACHRCLLGSVERREVELVSRSLALELLDELLATWVFEPLATIADVGIGDVEESELERRFRIALRTWASRSDAGAILTPRPGAGPREALELRITDGEQTRRYLIEEQQNLDTSPKTRPDFVITRQDDKAPQVAVYLDGFQFHASSDGNRLADDSIKREAVRASGRLVWNLTWQDVDAFHKTAAAEVAKEPPDRPLLPSRARQVAAQIQHQRDGVLDVTIADRNPVRLLLDFLRRPDLDAWERVALSVTGGLASMSERSALELDQVSSAVRASLRGQEPDTSDSGPVVVCRWHSANELPLVCLLDGRSPWGPNAERWTTIATLRDDEASCEEASHQPRWRDWLQWANVLQFLRGDGRRSFSGVVSRAELVDLGDFAIVPAALAAPTVPPTERLIEPEVLEELELLHESVRPLVESVMRRGAPPFVAGYELGDAGSAQAWTAEAAWPEQRVAVVLGPDAARDAWLADRGWNSRPTDAWTETALIEALSEAT